MYTTVGLVGRLYAQFCSRYFATWLLLLGCVLTVQISSELQKTVQADNSTTDLLFVFLSYYLQQGDVSPGQRSVC